MSDGVSGLVEVSSGLGTVPEAAWDRLVDPDDPFCRWRFLAHLENTGAVGPDSGWRPAHLLWWSDEARTKLVGAAPLYLKAHSYGEYIFDWGWAQASERAGLPYYPKLVSAVPFTPSGGGRLLVGDGPGAVDRARVLAKATRAVAEQLQARSAHILFSNPDVSRSLADEGWIHRLTHQYHWRNDGFRDFDDFLATLRSRKRKEVRRERRRAAASGLSLAVQTGMALSDEDLSAIHACYLSTVHHRGGHPYLPRAWFLGLREVFGHDLVVATARDDAGHLQAMALAFQQGSALYGRYWGARVDAPDLHFELCYYRLIEWAIAHGLQRLEAGAQGEHKLARGFVPQSIHSLHWLAHPGLHEAVARAVQEEREGHGALLEHLEGWLPFHREDT